MLSGEPELDEALEHILSRWDASTRYLENGRRLIDKNLAECPLRSMAVTRKNVCFSTVRRH